MADTANTSLMRPDQVEVFANGLYHLANADGIDQREIEVIRAFLHEAGAPQVIDDVGKTPFDAARASEVLDTSFLRRVFLKVAFVLVKADGQLSPAERTAMQGVAEAFGLADDLSSIEAEVEGQQLD